MKHYIITFFISILLIIVLSHGVHNVCSAQKAYFKYFSLDEGLPQATVYEILSDNEGYLWFGTQGGIARFDGKTFEIYNQENGLAGNHAVKLYQDRRNNIWIGYRYEGVSKLVLNEGEGSDGKKFYHYNEQLRISGHNKSISDIVEDKLGNMWIGTKGNGVYVLNFKHNDSLDFILKLTTENGIRSNNINVFEKDENGNIWVGTNEGIAIIDPDNPVNILNVILLSDFGFQTNHITDIKITGLNSAWIATLSGFCNITFDAYFNIKINIKYEDSDALTFQQVKQLCLTSKGVVWLATTNGAIRFDNGIFKKFTEKEGLSNNNVSSIIEDREGNIWIGVWGSGACQYLGDNFELFDKQTGLSDNIVHAILIDKDNSLWVGTEKGITRFLFSDTLMNNITSVNYFTIDDGLSDNDVKCIYQDSRDFIWIGTRTGVTRYDPVRKSFKNFTKENALVKRRIISINEDKNGNVWLCDLGTGCTKFTFDQNGEKLISSEEFTRKNGFFSNSIWIVYKDRYGDLWFGSDDAGLAVYDGKNFKIINEQKKLMHKREELVERPAAITEDKYGNLWIGTIGGGVYKYEGNKFTNYTTKDGISADNPYLVLGDDIGNVWIGTNTGVDRLEVNTGKINHYGKSEGFMGIETNQNAVYKDGLGNIWFGRLRD